ncbi:MAG: DUF4234 domain-containing protein [Desulfobacteraceae bacterium]|nr:DUF4234 domain-containing protein [Desulfobacteraceae bacterium]
MSTITELKDQINTKTVNLVLLSIATAGIYPLMWLYENYKIINDKTNIRTADDAYIIWMAVCGGLSGAFSGTGEDIMDLISAILAVASAVLYIIWAFRAKKALQEYALHEHKIDLRMNGFYTFLFNIYYINYCINDLPEAQRKQQILTGQSGSQDS